MIQRVVTDAAIAGAAAAGRTQGRTVTASNDELSGGPVSHAIDGHGLRDGNISGSHSLGGHGCRGTHSYGSGCGLVLGTLGRPRAVEAQAPAVAASWLRLVAFLLAALAHEAPRLHSADACFG